MGRFLLFLSFFLNTANIGFAGAGPQPWQLGFRPPATPTMEKIVDFHNYFLNIIKSLKNTYRIGLYFPEKIPCVPTEIIKFSIPVT